MAITSSVIALLALAHHGGSPAGPAAVGVGVPASGVSGFAGQAVGDPMSGAATVSDETSGGTDAAGGATTPGTSGSSTTPAGPTGGVQPSKATRAESLSTGPSGTPSTRPAGNPAQRMWLDQSGGARLEGTGFPTGRDLRIEANGQPCGNVRPTVDGLLDDDITQCVATIGSTDVLMTISDGATVLGQSQENVTDLLSRLGALLAPNPTPRPNWD
jgi:hypothetical protein